MMTIVSHEYRDNVVEVALGGATLADSETCSFPTIADLIPYEADSFELSFRRITKLLLPNL